MKKVIITSLLLLHLFVSAQKRELGKVTIDELKESVCPTDSSAPAAILFNLGEVKLDFVEGKGFMLNTKVKTKIKIYKKEGYELANQFVRYYIGGNVKESVLFRDAATYNLVNGKIEKSKLKSDGEFDDMEQRDSMERAFQSGEYSALEENKTAINEVKRMQLLAGLITESQLNEEEQLDSKEQELVDAVLGDINEGIDFDAILKKVKSLANKGLLTAAMASVILSSCGSSNDTFKREVENAKKIDSLERVQQAKIDSVTNSMTTGVYK
jgi:hypothetical protein